MEAEPDLRSRMRTLIFQIALPAVLVLALSALMDTNPVIAWIAKYRPTAVQSSLELNVARQVLATDARLREADHNSLVAIIGSSAVVNGVDTDLINAVWRDRGLAFTAVNLGQTGLVAYELALLKRFTLAPKVKVVVFLYNSFSFADQLLATVVGVRWSTDEMLRLRPMDPWSPDNWRRYTTGIVNEAFAVIRYGGVLKSIATRGAQGKLAPIPYFQDFPPEPNLDPLRDRVAQPPAPADDWLRSAYVDSEWRDDTVGYRGFARFLELAHRLGVRVIVAPVPEPVFSRLNKWRIGTDPDIVDQRVADLSVAGGATIWSRDRTSFLEANDTLFRDQTHFNRFGRERYSLDLADWLAKALH
jgi:hypothetical protein